MKPLNPEQLYSYGLALLTHRERSEQALLQKLTERGEPDTARLVLDRLVREGWASDRRFVESYTRYRIEKGFGPLHIKQHLFFEGISSELFDKVILEMDVNWDLVIGAILQKKFKNLEKESLTPSMKGKIQRFLASRGFELSRVWICIRKLS
jgi:regulatory protein